MLLQSIRCHIRPGGRHDVGDELVAGCAGDHQHNSVDDRIMIEQYCFDLAEFDPLPAELDLEVRAAEVVEFTTRGPVHQVAGAIHTLAGHERVGDEAIRGEIDAAVISACQLVTCEIQLARDAGGYRT